MDQLCPAIIGFSVYYRQSSERWTIHTNYGQVANLTRQTDHTLLEAPRAQMRCCTTDAQSSLLTWVMKAEVYREMTGRGLTVSPLGYFSSQFLVEQWWGAELFNLLNSKPVFYLPCFSGIKLPIVSLPPWMEKQLWGGWDFPYDKGQGEKVLPNPPPPPFPSVQN